MANSSSPSGSKRRFLLTVATAAVGGAGAVAVAVPFVRSMNPSARARAAGAPVEVDISKVEPGMMITVEWRGQPVWIVHRTPEMLANIPKMNDRVADPESSQPLQPAYVDKETRSIKPDYLVLVGICSHLGCSPTEKLKIGADSGLGDEWLGGFYCPCHGSKFDVAGRVLKGMPAPVNLKVPPYTFLSDSRILIGQDKS
ncbi:MAG: ubiquinol-cytochrome c reductase iron-sulfur subunit [Burkholderiales bacterium]|nr:ubiquinol-cytochrome c reductase iron-sulfur subunit [Burkholderiales bacterium]